MSDDISKKIYDRFIDDCAGWACSLTNIFEDKDTGAKQIPYAEQVQFMNRKRNKKERVIVVLKSRQCGFTTAVKARAMFQAYFGLLPNIIIASAGEKQANKVLAEIKDHFRSMPEPLRPVFLIDNASELLLSSGSKITSVPANPQTVRGNSAEVIWDEAGVFSRKESDEFWSAIFPSISKGWAITLISTPKGKDNKFYDLCNPKLDEHGNPVEKGVRANLIIKVSWEKVPHIKEFVEETGIEDYSDKMFLQEYCCEFLDAAEDSLFGVALVDGKFIDKDLQLLDLKFLDFIEGPTVDEKDIIDLKGQFDKIFIGYDPAISEAKDADGSGVCAVGVKGDSWTILFVRNLQKGLNQAKQCDYVSRLALCLKADKVGFDSTGGMGLTFKERLEETPIKGKLVPVVFSSNLKQQGYMEIKGKMETGKMKSPVHSDLRKQVLNLGFNPVTGKVAAMGSWRSNKDDLISSLLCAHECKNKKSHSGFSII